MTKIESNPGGHKTLALTAGEPAGVGADLCVALAQQSFPDRPRDRLIVLADRELLSQRARQMNMPLKLVDFDPAAPARLISGAPAPSEPGALEVWHHPLREACVAGQLNPANSPYVLDTLTSAAHGCLNGTFDALVTAPVHKGIINQAGFPFTGHTEFLAELSRTPRVVMMLVGGGMRVALATTHLPLREVADAITPASLEEVIRILHQDLVKRFSLANPRILVAGLNPHAGEGGHLGREELDVMIPVLDRLRAEGMNLAGPFPADTLFTPRLLAQGDCVLAMYHDQGLPVLKHASFGGGVNVTLGLSFIRTSVDHGTALELAGTGRAELGSLLAALNLASSMAGA